MRLATIALLVLLTSCGGSSSSLPETLVTIGDSITLRTGLCLSTDTLASCNAAGRSSPATAYPTYLPNVVANLGRGGDTCTTQPGYVGGPFDGQSRGLLTRLDEAIKLKPTRISVLIGTNDINSFSVPLDQVVACNAAAWDRISAAGIEPIVITYGLMPAMKGTKELNAALRLEAGKRGLKVVDFETISPYVTVDGIHPDQATAQQEAQLFMKVVQ